ncbi:MAG: YaaA family protein, partial [Mangrovicoccus sp.]
MLILLSPAKNLNETRASGHASTQPRFLDAAEELVATARHWSDAEISEIMKVSAALAKLNGTRFSNWSRQADCAAALIFDGDVYKELDYATLDDAAKSDAARRLRFLSGLYGLLRPTDAVCAYRLEMGRKIPGHEAGTLYKFWGARIAEAVAEDARAYGSDLVLNLASEEYSKAVDPAGLGDLQMISPRFEEERGGARKVIAVMAKRARGAMARWALQSGAQTGEDLASFTTGGYRFDAEASSPERPVF